MIMIMIMIMIIIIIIIIILNIFIIISIVYVNGFNWSVIVKKNLSFRCRTRIYGPFSGC